MSSSVVRAAARSLESALGWPAGLPFHETLADAPDMAALPETWWTAQFDGDSDDPPGIGNTSPDREMGTVSLVFLGRSGTGDATLIALIEQVSPLVRPHFLANGINVTSLSAPQVADPGVDGEWLRFDLTVNYHRDHV